MKLGLLFDSRLRLPERLTPRPRPAKRMVLQGQKRRLRGKLSPLL